MTSRHDECKQTPDENERLRMFPIRLISALLPVRAVLPRPVRQLAVALGLAGTLTALPLAAQSPFSAALYVNDAAITHYEIDQRSRFLEFIGAGGGSDARETARERLIEERLQVQEAGRLGLRVSAAQVSEGMNEFAARAELSAEELITLLRQAGIDPETFSEFIRAGVMWRELVQARFGPDVAITSAQIDRALNVASVRPVPEVLISEIFLPDDPQFAEIVQQLIPQILEITSLEEFSAAARQVSAAPSAETGGRVERWLPLATLPAPIQTALSNAAVGQVIGPLEVPGAFAFFQLRAQRDNRDVPAGDVELEFRRAALPGGRSEANLARVSALREGVDSCGDLGRVLGRVAPELPEGAAPVQTLRAPQVPAGYATELARLEPGQITANLVEGGDLVVLMLCARRIAPDPAPDREAVRFALFSQTLEGMAEVYLQTLRADAEIRSR